MRRRRPARLLLSVCAPVAALVQNGAPVAHDCAHASGPFSAAGYGAGSTAQMLAGARRPPADLAAFLELHIEQVFGCVV